MKQFVLAAVLASLGLLAMFHSASAHAQIDHCAPVPGTAVAGAPKEARCWFTEEIDDKQSTLTVTDATGARVDNGDGHVDLNDPNHQQMFATLKTIPSGVYKVAWHAVTTDDNGVTEGTWYFGVGQVAVPTFVAPTPEPTSASAQAPSATIPVTTTTTAAPAATSAATSAPAPATSVPVTATTAATTAPAAAATSAPTTAATSAPTTAATSAPTAAAPATAASASSPAATSAGTTAPTSAGATPVAPLEPPAAAGASVGNPAVVYGAGLVEALAIIGVLLYLFRSNP